MTGERITTRQAKEEIKADFAQLVAEQSRFTMAKILSNQRDAELVDARQRIAIELRILKYSYPMIGRVMRRDHTGEQSRSRTLQEFGNGYRPDDIPNAEGERLQGQCERETHGGTPGGITARSGSTGISDTTDYENRWGGTDESPSQGSGVRLNPQFIEWMMGFPTDWTLVEPPPRKKVSGKRASKAAETQ